MAVVAFRPVFFIKHLLQDGQCIRIAVYPLDGGGSAGVGDRTGGPGSGAGGGGGFIVRVRAAIYYLMGMRMNP